MSTSRQSSDRYQQLIEKLKNIHHMISLYVQNQIVLINPNYWEWVIEKLQKESASLLMDAYQEKMKELYLLLEMKQETLSGQIEKIKMNIRELKIATSSVVPIAIDLYNKEIMLLKMQGKPYSEIKSMISSLESFYRDVFPSSTCTLSSHKTDFMYQELKKTTKCPPEFNLFSLEDEIRDELSDVFRVPDSIIEQDPPLPPVLSPVSLSSSPFLFSPGSPTTLTETTSLSSVQSFFSQDPDTMDVDEAYGSSGLAKVAKLNVGGKC